ncbi:bifunctional ornithine acetyltransferase/N-acetylglutamate synthase [Helicobacter enhydrae]|uniref:Arginine biosynthesis bifunctional protein ArgJ n=1 Tax=Helicobacter enhydrae TaxID=222136 RepID=A0A1B1U4V4_9HELI|nr:bifunctional glutamate N-acetyltransferase/amino-acid acetyltransferase ArgJ [Helicobacter enhydrae]ANV97786.1 bifunctional ornithine acetyltransferase/N-acetylglutamate synthase [Helicobacter enhydrae]
MDTLTYDIFPIEGGVCAPCGFYADGVSAGFKPDEKLDVAFIYMDTPCEPYAVFTTNRFQAAPIRHYLQEVSGKESNFVLINTKNANAMTGKAGIEDIHLVLEALKQQFPQIQNPISSSTGVIGVRLDTQKLINSFEKFTLSNHSTQSATRASEAIRTTDSFAKQIALRVELENGESFHIGAMAKGAGMIEPSMATMLCFITTDAQIPQTDLKELTDKNLHTTFNAISVDGDTSTNDSLFVFANGKSGAYHKQAFDNALAIIMKKLATDIVKDGEGAQKLVAFRIKGAKNQQDAICASKALANSLLVKTALFGSDPNWGRIASTIGASGVQAYEERLKILIEDICVFDCGTILFDPATEEKASKIMQKDSFHITCDLGVGDASFTAYACDLGHQYVKINSDYRS